MAAKLEISILLGICIAFVNVGAQPNFFTPPAYMVSHYPEVGRSSDFYIYAIDKFSSNYETSITKDGGLPSSAVETGVISKDGEYFGCFLKVHDIPHQPGIRYGQYQAVFAAGLRPEHTSYTFVKPKSGMLDTRGVQTLTIYPESTLSNNLEQQVPIGVQWTPGCNRITWSKGKQRSVNRGPRLNLRTTEDAGLYRIQRPGRGKRGFYVQILVTAASCPRNYFYIPEISECEESPNECTNGGVLRNDHGLCICPPSFWGPLCQCYKFVDHDDSLEPIMGVIRPEEFPFYCRDLPGGNPYCKGHLVCLGDNYGCTCATGWYGNACDKPCRKGRFGVNCKGICPRDEPDCNRFYGPLSNIDSVCVVDD